MTADTIFALSSGRGRAGVAVIRISGPRSTAALESLGMKAPPPRLATLAELRDPINGEPLDQALVLFFKAPSSFTGENTAELHVHGGVAVVDGILDALSRIEGLRSAEPGEFARRAFANGKIDLTQAEGLADLIEAETRAQRRQALRASAGDLKDQCDAWREELIKALSLVEAAIDFSDEADVPELVEKKALPVVTRLKDTIAHHLSHARRGERLRDGVQIVLAGAPNAGKSSLLNALSRREAAMVSQEPGTTRDVIEVHLDLDGYPVTLLDTAGLREAEGEIEREGMRRTLQRASDADLVIWLVDGSDPQWTIPSKITSSGVQTLVVLNKTDLAGLGTTEKWCDVAVSALTGAGMDALLQALTGEAARLLEAGEPAIVTRARQRRQLEECTAALEAFSSGDLSAIELRAEDLRVAAHALGRVTGAVDVEDILDRIFGDFCIGK